MLAATVLGCALAGKPQHNFTVYSQAVRLRYGEVHNRVQFDPVTQQGFPLPEDVVTRYRTRMSADGPNTGTMAVVSYDVDMVRRDAEGRETSVPLWDHYNHHFIMHIGGASGIAALRRAVEENPGVVDMQGRGLRKLQRKAGLTDDIQYVDFGGAAGAEYRHNPHRFPDPFRMFVRQPEVFAPELHMINTLHANATPEWGKASPLLQCPCTPQRDINVQNWTINGEAPDPAFGCSEKMKQAGNPSCGLETYTGGWRCCHHGVMLVDTSKCREPDCAEWPRDEVYMRFTFTYEDADEETRLLYSQGCCDVSSDHMGDGNIEYDVPQCAAGTPPEECVYVFDTVQPMDYYDPNKSMQVKNGSFVPESELEVDLVYAAAHLHVTGISLEMIDAVTNETLCKASRANGLIMYGEGKEVGNEAGYLTGITPCVWGGPGKVPPRRKRSHPIRTRAVYNATEKNTGVMALWLNEVAQAPWVQ